MTIYLVGYMGSGKSKAAEALAKILDYHLIDTDELIVETTGQSITEIFKTQGEEYFREIEKKVLRNTENKKAVVATGGGTPCFFDNMSWMNEHGITVYLEANAGLLFHRLALFKQGRPLIESLSEVELMEQITGNLAVRIPYYSNACITVPAANLNPKVLAEKIKSFKRKSA